MAYPETQSPWIRPDLGVEASLLFFKNMLIHISWAFFQTEASSGWWFGTFG